MEKPDCDNIYCANCKAGQGNYEHVMGFLCERCERVYDEQKALEPGGSKNPYCPICGEPKVEHEGPFPCVERACCDTIEGEPHNSDCPNQTQFNPEDDNGR